MPPIIRSMLDDDLYKVTMGAAVAQLYPDVHASYKFINRGDTEFPEGFASALEEQLDHLSSLALTPFERDWLTGVCPYIPRTYLDLLFGYRYNPEEVAIKQEGGNLEVLISGPWYRTILWEVKLLAIISELYFQMMGIEPTISEAALTERNEKKARSFQTPYADLGTRRRFSRVNHHKVCEDFQRANGEMFVGTSNMKMAMDLALKVLGTQAHEWFMFHAAKYGFQMANSTALGRWADVYHGELGIALSDTFTSQSFFEVFDTFYAKLYDGVRHDSGDPFVFADNVIAHYNKLGIDPRSKTIIFSDGLNVQKALEIAAHCGDRIKFSFGIGTHFTNDVGATPLNIVIKAIAFRWGESPWVQAVKLSDSPGKHTGDPDMIDLCQRILRIGPWSQ